MNFSPLQKAGPQCSRVAKMSSRDKIFELRARGSTALAEVKACSTLAPPPEAGGALSSGRVLALSLHRARKSKYESV